MPKYHSVNPASLQAVAEETAFGSTQSGPKQQWLSMKAPGRYVFRLAPPWSEEGTPCRKIVNHNDPFNAPLKNAEGRRVAPLCLDYVFSHANIAGKLKDLGVIGADDLKAYKAYGCPLCMLPRNLKRTGVYDKEQHKDYWPKTQYIFQGVLVSQPSDGSDEVGELHLYSVTKQRFDDINLVYQEYPQLFDPAEGRDMIITATGPKDRTREYKITFSMKASKMAEVELYDLDLVMRKGAYSFEQMMEILKSNRHQWSDSPNALFGDLA